MKGEKLLFLEHHHLDPKHLVVYTGLILKLNVQYNLGQKWTERDPNKKYF